MRQAIRTPSAVLATAALATCLAGPAAALDQVSLGTDWKAEAEHGGYYQAIATGIYAKYGLEVSLRQGGPQVNHSQLLAAGRLDFDEEPNSFLPLNFVKENIPMVAVAAMFQKDPMVLIAHAEAKYSNLAALKGKPIMIGADTRVGPWLFLKSKFGFTDDQIRIYNFNIAPFMADQTAVQQGYVTSEPFLVEKAGGKPQVFLLANEGYATYASVIETSRKMVQEKPDLVQRFVNASIEGWYSYLYGDPSPANALIKKDNPEETDELLAYAIKKIKEYGVVDSGESLKLGIGAMTADRWKAFHDVMSKQGLYPADLDYKKAYTLKFVNKSFDVGMRK